MGMSGYIFYLMEREEESARERAWDYICGELHKEAAIDWVDDNWPDFIEKHKDLFE